MREKKQALFAFLSRLTFVIIYFWIRTAKPDSRQSFETETKHKILYKLLQLEQQGQKVDKFFYCLLKFFNINYKKFSMLPYKSLFITPSFAFSVPRTRIKR